MTDLVALLDEAAARFADEPAVAGGRTSFTYEELADRARRGAARLRDDGLQEGDAVLLASSRGPSGRRRSSPSFAPAASPYPSLRTSHLPQRQPPSCTSSRRILRWSAREPPGCSTGFPRSRSSSSSRRRRRGPVVHPLAMLAFTSGSTDRPRAVELTHGNLIGDLEAMLHARTCAPGDAFLSMLPPAHLFELMGGLLGPLACGARIVYPGAPLPNRLVEALREAKITHAMAVPALVEALYGEVVEQLLEVGILRERAGRAKPGGDSPASAVGSRGRGRAARSRGCAEPHRRHVSHGGRGRRRAGPRVRRDRPGDGDLRGDGLRSDGSGADRHRRGE